MNDVEYLGDGVYCYNDGYQLWLVTGNHLNPDSKIALDPRTLAVFLAYIAKHVSKEEQSYEQTN